MPNQFNFFKGINITAFPYAGIAGAISFLNEYGKFLLK
jgi:alpha-aminoadipic semialdehyde synthase